MRVDEIMKSNTEETNVRIRAYSPKDAERIVKIYKESFAEEPWNEYMKCPACNANYGIDDAASYEGECTSCGSEQELAEYFPAAEIVEDIESISDKEDGLLLTAEVDDFVVGFAGGYPGFPDNAAEFLEGKIDPASFYLAELAVDKPFRHMGIGKQLTREFLDDMLAAGYGKSFLRTKSDFAPIVKFYEDMGYEQTEIVDPVFTDRIFMVWEGLR